MNLFYCSDIEYCGQYNGFSGIFLCVMYCGVKIHNILQMLFFRNASKFENKYDLQALRNVRSDLVTVYCPRDQQSVTKP